MIKKLIFIFIGLIVIFYVNYRLDERFLFFADNSTKVYQGMAVIYNQYETDILKCQWQKNFDNCRFHFLANTMKYISSNEIQGVFPIALSFINALIIKFLGYEWILWIPTILLLLIIYILYQLNYLNLFTSLVVFLATPLLGTSIMFLDAVLHLFFILFFYIYLIRFEKKISNFYIFFLGFLSGLNIFFRYEGEIFILVNAVLLFVFHKNYRNRHFLFLLGNILAVLLFIIVNLNYYSSLFGVRLEVNYYGIFNFNLKEKLIMIFSILWGDSFRIGFFQYMPYLIFLYLFLLVNFNKFAIFWKIQIFSIVLTLIIFTVLSPNQGGVDYGSRYLSTLIIPSVYFLKRSVLQRNANRFFYYLILVSIFVSLYFTNKYIKNIIKNNQECVKLYNQIDKEFTSNTIWIFHNHYLPGLMGITLFDNQSLVIRKKEDAKLFIESIKNRQLYNQYPKILIFNSNFQLEKNNEKNLFYEDTQVKEYILKELSEIYKIKKIKYVDNISSMKPEFIYLEN